MRAAAGGGGDSGSAGPRAAVTERRVLIRREVLVYLVEQSQLDVDAFNLQGFWNQRAPTAYTPRRARSRLRRIAESGVYRSVIPWDQGHRLPGQAKIFSARPPH